MIPSLRRFFQSHRHGLELIAFGIFAGLMILFLSVTEPSDCVRDAHGYRACPGKPRHPLHEEGRGP